MARSARVLKARGHSGDGAEDEVDVALALLRGEGVAGVAHELERMRLRDREHVDEGQAGADDGTEDAAVLQRPLVAGDGEHPLAREAHLVEHHLAEVLAVAQVEVHAGDVVVCLGERHLDVVDEGREQRPLGVGLAQSVEVAELLARRAQTVPCGEVDARRRPREDPRDRSQVVEGLGAQAALSGTAADGQQADLGQGRDGAEPLGEALGVEQLEVALARVELERLGDVGELAVGLGVDVLDRGCGLQERGAGDRLDVATGQRGVAVAREDDLALLGQLEAAVDGALGLREDRAVSRASAHCAMRSCAACRTRVAEVGPASLEESE